MNAPVRHRMTVAEYFDWAQKQLSGRYELADGEVVTMSPERARHIRAKTASWLALRDAIAAASLPYEVLGDGITVVIDEYTAREPDVTVQHLPVDADALVAEAPIILVEVLSPSSARSDTGEKLAEYFRLPSLRHSLIVNPGTRNVIHHRRSADRAIATDIVTDGTLTLAPPGVTLTVADLFG